MTIYQIDQEIIDLLGQVDDETGEALFDPEKIEALQMERDRKVENLALAWKNLTSEAKAIKDEVESLTKRMKTAQNEAERAKNYLELVLGGEPFKTAKVAVNYRKSESVEVTPDFAPWAYANAQNLLRLREPEPDKTALKKALKDGQEIPFAALVTKQSIQIR